MLSVLGHWTSLPSFLPRHGRRLTARRLAMERRSITVRGIVQGVGFRPFVYDVATRLGLNGSVRNRTSGVTIDAEGSAAALDRLLEALHTSPPPLARIESV